MTEIESIITLARHYCINNYDYWFNKYSQEKSEMPYSDNDYNLFPRYNALKAILQGVETIIDKKFSSINDCKNELKNIGKISQTIFTENVKNKIENNAMNEERNKFILYIENTSESDLFNVSPLPYNRKLNKSESEKIRGELDNIWNFDGGYWEHSKDKDKIIFIMEKFMTQNDKNKIIEHIKKHDKMFFTVDEMDNDYETEILEINGCETVYTNIKFDWIIYISHEMYVAFGGKLLIGFLKELFSDRMGKVNKYEW
jgi:hypothetical protein